MLALVLMYCIRFELFAFIAVNIVDSFCVHVFGLTCSSAADVVFTRKKFPTLSVALIFFCLYLVSPVFLSHLCPLVIPPYRCHQATNPGDHMVGERRYRDRFMRALKLILLVVFIRDSWDFVLEFGREGKSLFVLFFIRRCC